MGKEVEEVKSFKRSLSDVDKITTPGILLVDLTNLWCRAVFPLCRTDLAEDGHVLVTIRTSLTDNVVRCTGLKNEGNSYIYLSKLLSARKVIPRRRKIASCFVNDNFAWTLVDPENDHFRSGDRVLFLLEENAKRVPRRPRKQGVQKKAIAKRSYA